MKKSKFNFGKFTLGLIFALQLAGAALIFSNPLPASAQTKIQSLNFVPQVTIPNSEFNRVVPVGTYNVASGTMSSDLLARYIKAFYNYGLAIAGILAAIVLMGGGVIWLTSGGDSGKVGQAKELISGSVVGIVILVCAWVILNTINPNLVKLKPIETTVVKTVSYCCDSKLGNVIMDKEGNCTSGTPCTGNSICTNTQVTGATNSFSCLNKDDYWCCQWKTPDPSDEFNCLAIKKNTACPKTNYDGFVWDRYHEQWCVTGIYQVDDPNKGCLDQAAFCQGKDAGTECSENNVTGWCYNNLCWLHKGSVGEPCGNRGGSKCYTPNNGEHCGKDENGAKLYTDSSGGRDCGTGIWCCNTKN